jgi:hypothetical protein
LSDLPRPNAFRPRHASTVFPRLSRALHKTLAARPSHVPDWWREFDLSANLLSLSGLLSFTRRAVDTDRVFCFLDLVVQAQVRLPRLISRCFLELKNYEEFGQARIHGALTRIPHREASNSLLIHQRSVNGTLQFSKELIFFSQ